MNSESFLDKKDNFIKQFETHINSSKTSGTIEISFKRENFKDIKSFNVKKKKEIIKKLFSDEKNNKKIFSLRGRLKYKKIKNSLEIPEDYVESFAQSIINTMRLDCFKTQLKNKILNKNKIPTQNDKNSNRTLRKKNRIMKIKEKQIKSKREKLEKRKRKEFLWNLAKGIKNKKK